MKSKPISVSTCVVGNMVVTTVVCSDGKVWQQNGQRSGWTLVKGPWSDAVG